MVAVRMCACVSAGLALLIDMRLAHTRPYLEGETDSFPPPVGGITVAAVPAV